MMSVSDPDSVKAAHNMSEMWSTFAGTGRPAAEGQPPWPAYTTEKRSTMEINTQCRVVDDPYGLERSNVGEDGAVTGRRARLTISPASADHTTIRSHMGR
jgi:carboxylesterase type B